MNSNFVHGTMRSLTNYWRNRHAALIVNGSTSNVRGLTKELTDCGAFVEAVLTGGEFTDDDLQVSHAWTCREIGEVLSPVQFAQWLRNPPSELTLWLDRIDPERALIFIAHQWTDVSHICGRPVHGWSRPKWGAFEDKTLIDAFWHRNGICSPLHEVVSCDRDAVIYAFSKLDQGDGVVISADSSRGHSHSGQGLTWVGSRVQAIECCTRLQSRSNQLRLAQFVHGVPCSVIGLVAADGTAVFEPVEIVTLLDRDTGHFLFCGSSTRWRPEVRVRDALRQIAKLVGESISSEVNYRGIFSVDGILRNNEFLPTELNPRHVQGLGLRAGAPDFPIYLFNRAVRESVEGIASIPGVEIEHAICDTIGLNRSHTVTIPEIAEQSKNSTERVTTILRIEPDNREHTVTYKHHGTAIMLESVVPPLADEYLSGAAAAVARHLTGRRFTCFADKSFGNAGGSS